MAHQTTVDISQEETADLVTQATYRRRAADPQPSGGWKRHPLTRADFTIAAIVVLAALLVRWPFVQVGETLLNPDEAIVGLMALDIKAGESLPIYFYGQRYMGSLEAFIIAGLTGLFDNPVDALRFGPTCVFAVFAGLQFLMLTRWFGRRGGLAGAAILLACSPMFLHWSVSARGGYIEVLLWGAALLWAYSEWFVEPRPRMALRRRHRLLFGLIVGSGFWINPSIILFIAPIMLHALLNKPLAKLDAAPKLGGCLVAARDKLGITTLPVAVILALLALNAVWAVWVDMGRVRHSMLFGLGPSPAAYAIVAAVLGGMALYIIKKTTLVNKLRELLMQNAAMFLGIILGATPALIYTVQATLGFREMDPSLPMGIRPLWTAGETLVYLLHGLPLLFEADPRPFVGLMGIGHTDVARPLGFTMSGLMAAANWLVAGGLLAAVIVLVRSQRPALSNLFRLRPANHPAAVLLFLALAVSLSLFVMGGCAMNFTTIRYLVPIWVFVPGLVAAACVNARLRRLGPAIVVFLCTGYVLGQTGMHRTLGEPHPMRAVADALQERGLDRGIAEPLDAHILSFMTARECRLAEFESFWTRFPHHRALIDETGPVDYVVETDPTEWTLPWAAAGWPGWPPPETMRFLWPKLRRELMENPDLLLSREPLTPGFELFRLRRQLPEKSY